MTRLEHRSATKTLFIGLDLEDAFEAARRQGFKAEWHRELPERGEPGFRDPDLVVVADLADVPSLAVASVVQGWWRLPVLSFPSDRYPPVALTETLLEIFTAIAHGKWFAKSIAREIGLSERRVYEAFDQLAVLLKADSHDEAIALAIALGLIYRSRAAWRDDPGGEPTP